MAMFQDSPLCTSIMFMPVWLSTIKFSAVPQIYRASLQAFTSLAL